jgi:ribosome-associated toxin RatA of RatAB toxin-antitoxin module
MLNIMNPEFDEFLPIVEQEAAKLAAAAPIDLTLTQIEVKTDWVEGRQRQISAHIRIPYEIERVWQILTDYEHLADFIPNLAKSRCITHPTGGIRLEQLGTQSFLKLKFCARVVLDMVEHFPHRLDFQMVEGDFKAFSGSWLLQALDGGDRKSTQLSYVVQVLPPRTMPVALIERCLKHDLAVNLLAIRQRAEVLFGST